MLDTLEAVAACIHLHNHNKLLLVSTYLPPSSPILPSDLDKIFPSSNAILLTGELNSKHPTWHCPSQNPNGTNLLTYCIDNNISIPYPSQPTHFPHTSSPSVLDIVLSKNRSLTKPVAPSLLSSDHNPVLFKLHLQPSITAPRTIYNYSKTDWHLFKSTISITIPPHTSLLSPNDLDQAVSKFEDSIRTAANLSIPTSVVNKNRLTLPPHLLILLRLKTHYRRKFQRTRTLTFCILSNLLTQCFLQKLQLLQNSKWIAFLCTLHPHKPSFWKVSRYLSSPSQSIPPLFLNGTQYCQTTDKATVLARQFELAHTLTLHKSTPHHSQSITRYVNRTFHHLPKPPPVLPPTNATEIKRYITALKPRTAPGADNITALCLNTYPLQH